MACRNTCIFIFSIIFLFTLSSGVVAKRVTLDITSPDVRKIIFAVPWFKNRDMAGSEQKYGHDLSTMLTRALTFHGIIDVIPQAKFMDGGSDWKALDADFTVLGTYTISKDLLHLELRLLDVSTNKMLMGKSYDGPSSRAADMIFKFTDAVIKELTGKPGIATSQIAFVSQPVDKREKEVFITDILGKKIRQITRHRNLIVSPRFSPDGNYLTYSSYHSGNQNLYITDLRQSKTTRALSRRKGINLAPAWSPSGKELIITLSYKGNPDLFLINRQGKIIRQLTKKNGINVSPTYSPDGKYIVFVSDRSRKPQLYLMELATGKTRRITYKGTENAEPTWSPSENLVVYSSLRNGIYQICRINPFEEGSSVQLTMDQTHHESPAWSPDGNQIIFAKRDGSLHKIYGIMKDGSFQRQLFSLPGSQTYPRWAVKNY